MDLSTCGRLGTNAQALVPRCSTWPGRSRPWKTAARKSLDVVAAEMPVKGTGSRSPSTPPQLLMPAGPAIQFGGVCEQWNTLKTRGSQPLLFTSQTTPGSPVIGQASAAMTAWQMSCSQTTGFFSSRFASMPIEHGARPKKRPKSGQQWIAPASMPSRSKVSCIQRKQRAMVSSRRSSSGAPGTASLSWAMTSAHAGVVRLYRAAHADLAQRAAVLRLPRLELPGHRPCPPTC